MRAIRQLFICLFLGAFLLTAQDVSAEGTVELTAEGSAESQDARPSEFTEAEAGVMVRPFEGPKSQKLHSTVVKALESAGVILIPPGFEEGVSLAEEPDAYVEVARKTGIKAYIHAKTTMSNKGWTLHLRVRNGADGKIVAEPKLSAGWLPGLLKKIDTDVMGVLEGPLAETSLPSGASEEGDVSEVTLVPEGQMPSVPIDQAPERDDELDGPAVSPLDAWVGVGAVQRNLGYNSPLGDVYEHGLQPHSIAAPALTLGLHLYPGAYLSRGLIAHIGIYAAYTRTFGGSTTVNTGTTEEAFDTSFTELNLGLRGRIPLTGSWEAGVNAGWGFQSLIVDGDNETPMGQTQGDPGVVPDVEYTYFRFGPDLSFELGLPIRTGIGYRLITLADDEGHFSEERWFPNAVGFGVDAHVTFAVALTDELAVDIGGEVRYYGIDANPGPWENNLDPFNNYSTTTPGLQHAVAAGASDTYFGAVVSGHYTMPGE